MRPFDCGTDSAAAAVGDEMNVVASRLRAIDHERSTRRSTDEPHYMY